MLTLLILVILVALVVIPATRFLSDPYPSLRSKVSDENVEHPSEPDV